MYIELFQNTLFDHVAAVSSLEQISDDILRAGTAMIEVIENGGKILVCGNGGSAADAQHFAAELTGRFEKERPAYSAIALTTDTSALTAIGNDYGFDAIFSRQVDALGQKGDICLCISTSGNSPNVLKAASAAQSKGLGTVGLSSGGGGSLSKIVDFSVAVSSNITARIQEAHIFILHFWCSMIEARLVSK